MFVWQSYCQRNEKVEATLQVLQQQLVLVLNAAAETARKKLADQYIMTYWIYQNKLPFTTGEKLPEVT